MESYEERMQKLIEQDIPPFLALCSEKDRKFLLKRDSDRTTEEYVRLLYIGLAFKMRGVFFPHPRRGGTQRACRRSDLRISGNGKRPCET